MNQNLKLAINAAISAGEEIIKIYESSDFNIEFKTDNSPLTKADKAAHKIIVDQLKTTPYPVLSEEGKLLAHNERKQWEIFWLVDPLDGTKEFIKRNGEFTVNIALIDHQTPVLGVVYVPVSGELYFADINGSFKIHRAELLDEKMNNAKRLPLSKTNYEFVVVGSGSHMNQDTEEFIQNRDKKGRTLKMISIGSSLKLCLVAEGTADCYPRLGPTMEWDTAAGHAIAKFAGKTVTEYPANTPLLYNKESLLNPWFVVQ